MTVSEKTKRARDAFTFSLGGMSTISSYVVAPAIADDHLNRHRDERLNRVREDQTDTNNKAPAFAGRFWLLKRLRTA